MPYEEEVQDVEFKQVQDNQAEQNTGTGTDTEQKLYRVFHVQVGGNPTVEALSQIATGVKHMLESKSAQEVMVSNPDISIFEYALDTPVDSLIIKGAITLETVAKTAWTVNQGYCGSLGDTSIVDWEQAGTDQQQNYLKAINNSLRFNYTPEQQAWLKSKTDDGWTYGSVKDEGTKKHPSILPYAALPKEIQTKDYLFRSVVNGLKSQLPVPSETREIEIVVDDKNNPFLPWKFAHLKPGLIFRFVGASDELVYRAVSEVYVDYLSEAPAFTADVETLNLSSVLGTLTATEVTITGTGTDTGIESSSKSDTTVETKSQPIVPKSKKVDKKITEKWTAPTPKPTPKAKTGPKKSAEKKAKSKSK